MSFRTEPEIDADALRDLAAETISSRRFLAVLWGFVLAFASAAAFYADPMGLTLSFLGALAVALLTMTLGKLAIDERLAQRGAYRTASGVLLAVSLSGVMLAALPQANDISKLLAVYFGIVAVFAYRAVVSRGPRAALAAVSVAMLLVVPFAVISLVTCGCQREHGAPPWTTAASYLVLEGVMVMVPILAIVTLLAFRPRHDFVPDARLLRQRQPE